MFSVLLSVYKKEQASYLRQSLESIFTQTLPPDEVILVKDGPLTEELEKVIEEYHQKYSILKIIPLTVNQGLGKALNEGLQYCSYDIIARMDTDDIAVPDRFEKQMAVFKRLPHIDVVSSWVSEFEEDTKNILSIRKLPENHEDIYAFAKNRSPINHPAVMFRKKAVITVGGYQHFPLFEDYFLWIRLLIHGAKFYNIQESLLYFRSSPDMFKRRGGWKYAWDELRFQKSIKQMRFISKGQFLKNITIRFIVRIIPNSLRTILYKKLLRK